MGQVDLDNALTGGRDAVRRHHWREAYELLRAADQTGSLDVDDLEGFAEAAWWNGRLDQCIGARERAYAMHLGNGRPRRAALTAIRLATDHFNLRAGAVGRAWMNRAEKLLQDEPLGIEHGFLLRLRARQLATAAGGVDEALALAKQIVAIGTQFGERDLIALGLDAQGRYLIGKGLLNDGMALLEEATVAALSGELTPHTTGVIYCNLIGTCEDIADYRRAAEWTDAAKRWCDRMAIAGFPGMCRVHRADVIRLRGDWEEAEVEARLALDELADFQVVYAREALYLIGEMRLVQGDLREAREAFQRVHELGRDPNPGLALLHLAEGKLEAANAAIRRGLNQQKDPLGRAKLLPAQALIAWTAGDAAALASAATELTETARLYATAALSAQALTADALVSLVTGKPEAAASTLCEALRHWRDLDAPYEEARSRVLLAASYRAGGDLDGAVLELKAARATFDRLGAVLDGREVARLLAELGQGLDSPVPATETSTRTFVFTDIVRSTALVEAMGDEAWNEVQRWHDQTLRRIIGKSGGEEIKHVGDGIFAGFEDVAGAIRAAIEIQRALADHRREHGFAPQVRIGVHRSTATRVGLDYRGKGVHYAARIAGAAQAGEILASWETARDLAISVSTPHSIELKGVAQPVEVVSINWR